MGKNRAIKSLGKEIGNIVVHKILVEHTNRPESLHHLKNEVESYRDNAIETSQEFNWNDSDKVKIKQEALNKFKKDMKRYYKDIKFPAEEVDKLIEETIKECII